MHYKLVSIIIPTFNRAAAVVEAIKSAKAQSYPATQIIVIDDGSKDDTAARIAQVEGVEYYYQANKGQAAARNLGLSYAKGEYIASLDSDDLWNEDFLETAVGALERYDVDFVFLNWLEISDEGQSLSYWERSETWRKYSKKKDGEWSLLDAEQIRDLFLKWCPAPSSAMLIRRSSFVAGWNEEMKIADDWFLILEMVLSKPSRAAFTLSRYWTKHIHSSNIFHGREKFEVIKELGLHDEPLFALRFREKLTYAEKSALQNRLAVNHLDFSRLNRQRDGFSLKTLQSIGKALALAPLKSVVYAVRVPFFYLRNRFRTAKNKPKQSHKI